MSFFNINWFNAGNNLALLDQTPIPTPYSKVTLYGAGTFDDVWLEDYIRTDAQINSLPFTSQPAWSSNTIMLALFNNNLQAGNVTVLPTLIDSWIVLRKGQNDAKFTKLAEIDGDIETYIDKLGVSKENYIYHVLPVTGGLIGEPLVSDNVPTDFTKVVLLDPTSDEGYSFCYDMQLSEISTEEDLIIQDTRGKFQTFLKGNKQVSVGSINVIATSNSTTDNEINQDILFLEGMRDFILNGHPKILKFPKGFIYKVYTSGFYYTKKDGVDSYGNQVYKVGFEYRECDEVI